MDGVGQNVGARPHQVSSADTGNQRRNNRVAGDTWRSEPGFVKSVGKSV